MSQVLINQYLADLSRLKKVSGEAREGIVSEAFKDLLKCWGRQHDLVFIPQYRLDSLTKDKRYVDGALLHELRVPFGYWEAKDEADHIDEEIARKFKRGYPQDNIIFEDSTQAVLIQHREEVMRCPVTDVAQLEKLLKLFFAAGQPPKCSLKAVKGEGKHTGSIVIDSETTLTGVPPEAWAYQLGNRCAIEWVLDQYKEKKPKDPTIREKFDTYRFADHKEKVIDLLRRVTTVSVETVRIVGAMKGATR